MDKDKIIGNSSPNVAFAAYGNWNVEEGNDYNLQLESKDSGKLTRSASSPNLLDASSFSLSSSSSSSSIEPLNDFSELLAQLPIKRGISKYYKGKSKTFTSLSDVRSVEDLAKTEIPHRKRPHNPLHSPKANISKKAGRSCFTSLLSKWNQFQQNSIEKIND